MANCEDSRASEPAEVSLELDQEAVALIGGRTVARSLPVWLLVSPNGAFPSRRWVRVRYRSSVFDDVARPLIRFETAGGIRDDPHFHPGLSLFSFHPALA
jgi:hypothetical protein